MSRVRPPRDEWSRINDLERRITAIERSNKTLQAIPNPAGGSGDFVLATQLAYGLMGQTVTTSENTGLSTWTDLATVGPEASVTIGTSGRAFVFGVCNAWPSSGPAGPARMGVSIDGAAPPAALQATTGNAVQPDGTPAAALLVVAEVLTGLSAGSHIFKMQYQQTGSTGTNGSFYNDRTLVVFPY